MLVAFINKTPAQEKCGIVSYQKQLKAKYLQLEGQSEFEGWLKQKIDERNQTPSFARQEAEIITIPVVVHLIHDGEPIGDGKNLSLAQVESQITVLNEDFRRTNKDASNTPTAFLPVAADIEIQFELAKRDPEGLSTDGIVRVQGGKSVYQINDQYELKRQSYWPAEDYLNIWVADIGNGFLGFAQFPVSTLQGLDDASNYALTDGVVVDYRAFGSVDYVPDADLSSKYNLGRTTTHEVGHFLGLRHIWGDSGECTIDDFCDDTPAANGSNNGLGTCTFPGPTSCGNDEMFQNYMDYTDDVCMNLFTEDQKSRMRVVIDNSPRRASLKTSKGNVAPVMVANDLGIRKILSPQASACELSITPVLEVRNYGTNTITSSSITVKVNGVVEETFPSSHSLTYLEIDTVTFTPIELPSTGNYTIEFEIATTNGVSDGNADNDQSSVNINIPETVELPVIVDFEEQPILWTTQNLDELDTWGIVTAPFNNASNQAYRMEFYEYELEGEIDIFTSPVIDMSNINSAALMFDVSYARFSAINDGLIVTVTEMCNDALTQADTVFAKFGNDLSTISTTSYFVPSGPEDWRNEFVDLSAYAGSEKVRVSFIAFNSFGNNLYLDNIGIVSNDNEDITLEEVISPSRVTCQNSPPLQVSIKNVGGIAIGYFELQYIIDGGSNNTVVWQSVDSLTSQESVTLTVDLPVLAEGSHTIELFALNPNMEEEPNTDDNFINYIFEIDNSSEDLPVKENFESLDTSLWTIINPDQDITWQIQPTTKGQSLVLNASNYEVFGQKDWFVSPILDFSNTNVASLGFDLAYSLLEGNAEELEIYVSTNCGETYQNLPIYSKTGDQLNTTFESFENFNPTADSLWRTENIDLSEFIGEENVRIAFVSTSNNGNNIYLDNIQVFTTETDNLIQNALYPNPSLDGVIKLGFTLNQKEDVRILVYNRTGALVLEEVKPNTLNQTYRLDLFGEPAGLYIVKVVGETFSFTKSLILTNRN
ncbi:T9SS type A sorting domain-containing protein [Fulvivirga sp. RKSG066]|uniref:T9SS-dependent choice-of-anchor J family protein n=1 Tax=Fulvivirga aurantia TaxID=2529383 RepID=UPI0012BC2872|nr:choice-of-anchor J domain-containing protein [Fulvivirga aurantia]MTI21532.1 T9SS type A sorting domain-containing protein [Fulvivirga aurantia]